MTATRVTLGAISLSNWSHFPISGASKELKPVMLPPGRARLWTNPWPTGSITSTKTIGIVRVCCSRAATAGVLLARSASSDRPTNSVAWVLKRVGSFAAKRFVDPDILALDPTKMLQHLGKGRYECRTGRIVFGVRHQHANAASLLGPLCVPNERQ